MTHSFAHTEGRAAARRGLSDLRRGAGRQQTSRAKRAARANLASKHGETKRCATKQRRLCPTNTGNQQTLKHKGSTNLPHRTNKNNLAKTFFFFFHTMHCVVVFTCIERKGAMAPPRNLLPASCLAGTFCSNAALCLDLLSLHFLLFPWK